MKIRVLIAPFILSLFLCINIDTKAQSKKDMLTAIESLRQQVKDLQKQLEVISKENEITKLQFENQLLKLMLAQSEKAQLTDPSINTVMDPQRTDQAIYTPSKNGDKINTEVSNSSTSIQKSTLDGEKNQPDEHNSTRGYTPSTGAKIYTGPRGGNYYINKNGNKVYIKKK